MKPMRIIYNPVAGQGRAGDRLPEVQSLLDEAGLDYEICLTERPGHGIELAREAAFAPGVSAVVAAGGDGTANEVINGLMSARTADSPPARLPALGVLCVGRGNDFAYGAGVAVDLGEGVAALAAGQTQPLDVGWLKGGDYPDGRYFGNGIGIGFDTIVGFEAAKLKRVHGFSSYLIGALKTLLFYYEAPPLRIANDDGEINQDTIQISIMNGRRMGGAFYMCPDASVSDGLFDYCIAGTPRRLQMLGLILKYMKGTQEGSEHITTGRSRRFAVEAAGDVLSIHADGETIATNGRSIEVDCLPAQLSILVNRRSA